MQFSVCCAMCRNELRRRRLWNFGTHPDTGNSGLMINADAESMVQLISVYGFKTDANSMMGVEKLANKVPDVAVKDAYDMIVPYPPQEDLGTWA